MYRVLKSNFSLITCKDTKNPPNAYTSPQKLEKTGQKNTSFVPFLWMLSAN